MTQIGELSPVSDLDKFRREWDKSEITMKELKTFVLMMKKKKSKSAFQKGLEKGQSCGETAVEKYNQSMHQAKLVCMLCLSPHTFKGNLCCP